MPINLDNTEEKKYHKHQHLIIYTLTVITKNMITALEMLKLNQQLTSLAI